MLRGLILTTAALIVPGAAAAAAPDANGETVIPFVSSISQIEWKAISNDSLYLRGGKGEWYVIRTSNRCSRLRSSLAISLEASAGNQLDRHGAVWVQGVRCPVASIVHSDGPPRKVKRGRG
jgi:hypothetical protein